MMDKLNKLKKELIKYDKIAIAYSGGVDSTFLLKVAHEVLGDKVVALTADSCFFTNDERRATKDFCDKEGIEQVFVELDVLSDKNIKMNPPNRCYYCKSKIFTAMKQVASNIGIDPVAEGSNMDDLSDYRPGLKAIEELAVISPLRTAGLDKEDIRSLSRAIGLDTWQKPSMACLASRIEYGEELTEQSLRMIEQAEKLLRDMGFAQCRVRKHGNIARIEVQPEEIKGLLDHNNRTIVVEHMLAMGFSYVTMDLKGFRVGSMNETISGIV